MVDAGIVRRFSWSAVFAGLAVALGTQIALSLLGLGIGAGTIDPAGHDSATASGLGIGAGIWFLVTTLLAIFAGGWVAGRVAGMPRPVDAALHGVVVWAVTTIATLWLLTTALGAVFSGATAILGNTLSIGASAVGAASPAISNAVGAQLGKSGITPNAIADQIRTTLAQTGDSKLSATALGSKAGHVARDAGNTSKATALSPQNAHVSINDLVVRVLHEAKGTVNSVDRGDLVNVVMARTHESRPQAEQTVDGWIAQAHTAQAQLSQAATSVGNSAAQAGTATARGVSRGGIFAFFLLLLGAGAGFAGGFVSLAKRGIRMTPVVART